MSNRFLVSVAAAALIAGTGFAYAQGTMGKEAPSGGAPAEHSAPSTEHAAPAAKSMAPSGMKATQSEQKAPGAMKNERAEDNVQGQKPNTMRRHDARSFHLPKILRPADQFWVSGEPNRMRLLSGSTWTASRMP